MVNKTALLWRSVVRQLAPFLRFLLDAESVPYERLGNADWEQALRIWGQLQRQVARKAPLRTLFWELAQAPDDEALQTRLADLLEREFAGDERKVERLAEFVNFGAVGGGGIIQNVGAYNQGRIHNVQQTAQDGPAAQEIEAHQQGRVEHASQRIRSGGPTIVQKIIATAGAVIKNVVQVFVYIDFHTLENFFQAHWPVLLLVLALNGLIWLGYYVWVDLYLLSFLHTLVSCFLACACVVLFYLAWRHSTSGWGTNWPFYVAWVTGLLCLISFAWQAWPVLFPERFANDEFGIAVARFGEGSAGRSGSISRDITDKVSRGLQDRLAEIRQSEGGENWNYVQTTSVGLISNDEEAQRVGRQLGADIVIWGWVTPTGNGEISIYFCLVNPYELSGQPSFPKLLLIDARFPLVVQNTPLDAQKARQAITLQIPQIVSFALGLAAYERQDYLHAQQQFALAEAAILILQGQEVDPLLRQTAQRRLSLARYYLARSYQARGEMQAGDQILMDNNLLPGDPAVPLSLAQSYIRQGKIAEGNVKIQEGIRLAQDWIAQHPQNNVHIRYDLGLAYALQGDLKSAAGIFDSIWQEEPFFYLAYTSAGRAYLQQREYRLAEERFQQAIEVAAQMHIDPAWAYLDLAQVYLALNDPVKSEQALTGALRDDPASDLVHYQAAILYETQANPEAAEREYQRFSQESSSPASALDVQAQFFARQNKYEQAAAIYQEMLNRGVGNSETRLALAVAYQRSQQPIQARQEFERLVRERPDLVNGWIYYGSALLSWGENAEAIQKYQQALTLDPGNCIAAYNLGLAYQVGEDIAAAAGAYSAVVSSRCTPDQVRHAQEKISFLRQHWPAYFPIIFSIFLSPTPRPIPVYTPTLPPTPVPWTVVLVSPTATIHPSQSPTDTIQPSLTVLPSENPIDPVTATQMRLNAMLTEFAQATITLPVTMMATLVSTTSTFMEEPLVSTPTPTQYYGEPPSITPTSTLSPIPTSTPTITPAPTSTPTPALTVIP